MNFFQIADAIESVLPERRPIEHHEASIGRAEKCCVDDFLLYHQADYYWLNRLERSLASYCGVRSAICVSSGTAALHLALLAAGVKANEEVLVPTVTFVATANAVRYIGAFPYFVGSPLGVGSNCLRWVLENRTSPNPNGKGRLNSRTGRVISALIVVDLLGFPANHVELGQLADEFGLLLIEDAAQALGASIGNRRCGSYGLAATLSFNNNKIVTGNGGGAVLTNDDELAAKILHLATTGRVPHPWKIEHDCVAYNYRMGNINAALACAQLDQIDGFISAKKRLLNRYKQVLDVPFVTPEVGEPNNWLVTILTDERKELLDELYSRGIKARALFTPLHELPMFDDCPRDEYLVLGEHLTDKAVCLPSGVGLA